MRSVRFRICSSSRVPSSICSMADTGGSAPITPDMTLTTLRTTTDDGRGARLRSMVPGRDQRGGVRDLRVQLHAPKNGARLALVRRLHGVPDRALHRDVRLPADAVPAVG